jgi:hypothetical protein
MKQKMYLCTIGVVILAVFGLFSVSASGIIENSHTITIRSMDEKINVSETSLVQFDGEISLLSFYDVWIPSDATGIRIVIEDHLMQYEKIDENTYRCDLSTMNNSNLTTIGVDVSYALPYATNKFSTMFLRNVSKVDIFFNDMSIGSLASLNSGTVFSHPLSITEESSQFNMVIIILMGLVIIVIVVSVLYVIKKRKPSQARDRFLESEEVLKTEYELLKEMLKQIEKYHRSEKIADETYHKLKEHYKQYAIEAMAALEKIGSKINE